MKSQALRTHTGYVSSEEIRESSWVRPSLPLPQHTQASELRMTVSILCQAAMVLGGSWCLPHHMIQSHKQHGTKVELMFRCQNELFW